MLSNRDAIDNDKNSRVDEANIVIICIKNSLINPAIRKFRQLLLDILSLVAFNYKVSLDSNYCNTYEHLGVESIRM